MNPMSEVKIEKVTLNVGAGKDANLLSKGVKLLKNLTGIAPVHTTTQKRIPTWGLRPGLAIGCKITLRGEKAAEILPRLLKAKDNLLKDSCFDNNGNVSFGIPEYIDIPESKYDPDIGIIGLQVSVTLKRPGFRVKQRSIKPAKVGKSHRISQTDAMTFFKEKFSVGLGE